MKILVRDNDHQINLTFPTALIFSSGTAWLANHCARRYAPDAMPDIPPDALKDLFAEFRRIKKRYGSWELVDVQSADGEKVKIIL